MVNKRFGYFMLISFLMAAVLLLVIQYNFSANISAMLNGNVKLLAELRASNQLREINGDLVGVESRIRAAIATNDPSHLEGANVKIVKVITYLDSLDKNEQGLSTKKDLKRLSNLAKEKLEVKNALSQRYLKLGNMRDTSFIANPRARRISDEITIITQRIYDSRQKRMTGLSQRIIHGSIKAKIYGNVIVAFMFISGSLLCWFIFGQFREQNKLIMKLDHSEKTALDALQIKENFLANMSHEIRTPLNSIIGFTSLLKRREQDPVSAEFVDAIEKAGENLLSIINDILDLSKIEAGMMRIIMAPFSVRGLTHSVETLFREKVREKGLTLVTHVSKELPDTLIGDATRLTQILVNLIGNAIKFSEHGSIDVLLYPYGLADEQLQLGVKVKDHGIGISREKLDSIFERFNQAEDFITRNYGGTGLGLSIVKTLIQIQQGQIKVMSAPGSGTEFDFFIPYTVADEQITYPNKELSDSSSNGAMDESIKLLVVDDNIMNQSLMRHLLMEWGASFHIVSNGLEAIEQLKVNSYDLVLMDIQMPKMDGYSTARYIRDILKLPVPIIAMTAHAMAGEREKCLTNGMNEYISKPINEEALLKLIGNFVTYHKPDVDLSKQYTFNAAFRVIDLSYMKDVSKGNTAYEKLVTGQFIDEIPKDIQLLFTALKNREVPELNSIAHNMKTSVAIMGLLPMLEEQLDYLERIKSVSPDLELMITNIHMICLAALEEAKTFMLTLEAQRI